jgi:hypothetical protein
MARIVALAVGLALTTGCMSRTLLNVEDAVDGQTTILTTLDVKSYVVFGQAKYVFWECGRNGDALTCQKRCDVRDDQGDRLKCQVIPAFGI